MFAPFTTPKPPHALKARKAISYPCLAVVVLNASEDAVEDAELVLRTGATAGIFTDMRCQDTRLAAAGQDGPYTRFNLPRMAAWDFALMNIGQQA